MQLYSEYLKENIDFPEDGSQSPHDVLEHVICFKVNAQYDYSRFICDPSKVSVKCIMWDEKGRRVIGLGEAGDNNLFNSVAKKYPIKMAVKRAFDDAALHFLLLPTKDYKLLVDWEEKQSNQPMPDEKPETSVAEKAREKAQEPADKKERAPASYEKTIVTIGRQRGKNYTVEQLAEKDPDSLYYIAYTYPQQINPSTPERLAVVEACRKWIEEHGGPAAGNAA